MSADATIPLGRYAPGGDIYGKLSAAYDSLAADKVYAAAKLGRRELTEAIAQVRSGPARGNTSAVGNFLELLVTDPFGAPTDRANDFLGNTFASLFRNKWVLLVLALLVLHFFGVFGWIGRKIKAA